jgi:hypothetical protein
MDTEREDTGWEDCGGDFVLREIFCEEEISERSAKLQSADWRSQARLYFGSMGV